MRVRTSVRSIAIVAVIALGAVACGGGNNPPASSGPSKAPVKGGKIVLGAEQWPQCLNPITSCVFASWYFYTAEEFVLPRLVEYDLKGLPQASPLVTELPSLDNGGITESPFTVTYKLNPDAVWSDGTPITSADVDFTWKAILNTTGTSSTAGYDQIDSIDTSDPATVKINFKAVYVDWVDLFGGSTGFVIEKAAFPGVNADKPDLKSEMNNEITFSGGPWMIQSWSKDQEVLVPNDKFWGDKPLLDQVTFVPREDQATEINSLLSGEVSAIYPQPTATSLLDQFKQNPNVKAIGASGTFDEALWFNLSKPPFDDLAVRQAFSYATDRQAIIDGVIKLNAPDAEVQNCGLIWFPGGGPWCDDSNPPFAQYTYDAAKAGQILEQDGYTKGSDGIYAKGGQPLTVTISTTSGNSRRQAITTLMQDKMKAAGIDLKIKFIDPTELFSNGLPKLDYEVALYASGGVLDPSVTSSFACENIPSEKNGFSGQNTDAWCNQQATDLMHQSDQELDLAKRVDLIHQIAALEAQDLPALPIEVLPNVSAWRADKIAGPIGDYNSSVYGFFFNMDKWYLAS